MNTQGEAFRDKLGREVKKASGWYIAFGVVLLIGGIAAVARPLHAGLTVALVVGWILLLSGIMGLVQALAARAGGGFLARLLLAVIYIAGG